MITDNLAPLFDSGQPGVRFRQGTILTWNSSTGENTIDLAGGTLTNVPILNTGEAIALKAGHVVGLLGQGSAWFIVGRVTPPNSADFAGASVAFASGKDFQQGFSVGTGDETHATVTLDVPSWVDEAAVMAVAAVTLVNSTAIRQEALLYSKINGSSSGSGGMALGIPPDSGTGGFGIGCITTAHAEVISSPGSTITCTTVTNLAAAFAANGINTATMNAIAIFRSTV
jgi:hypothetical protein